MDTVDPDLVNLLDTQADQSDVTNVHMRSTQEDTRMLEPDVVDRIHELSGQGLGSKRIARQLGISRNSVRRYLAGATVGFQERLAARRLDGPTLSEVHQLFGTVAEGNTVVIQQELASRGIHVDLRILQRAVATLRQEERARALATVRFETPPGQQIQIDFREKVVRLAGQPVKVHLMTAVLGHSPGFIARPSSRSDKTTGSRAWTEPSVTEQEISATLEHLENATNNVYFLVSFPQIVAEPSTSLSRSSRSSGNSGSPFSFRSRGVVPWVTVPSSLVGRSGPPA